LPGRPGLGCGRLGIDMRRNLLDFS
jgi:hypothetical protein